MSVSLPINSEVARTTSAWLWKPLGLIALAVLLAYSNSFNVPFVLDDIGSIPENPSIRRLSRLNEVFTGATFATVVGRPLLNLSLAVNYALHRLWLPGYHLFNLIAHVLTAWCLFGVVHRTLRLPQFQQRFSAIAASGLATTVALLWSVHPLTTSAVTYTVQRCEVMAAGWYLATLYCVIRGADSRRSDRWTVLAFLCCLMGVATKETLVTAPVVVCLYDAVFLSHSLKKALSRRPGLYFGLFATWLPLAGLMRSSGGRSETAGLGYGMSARDYALSQFGYVLNYLKLSIWPHPLVFDYGDKLARTWPEIVIPAGILVVLVGFLILIGRRHPAIAFLGLSPFLILAPTSSIVPLVTQTAAEHRMYLPLACVVTLVTLAAWTLFFERSASTPARARILAGVSVALLVLVLGGLTWSRNREYRSEYELWLDTVSKRPENDRARNNLGRVFLEQGDFANARLQLEVAVGLKPDNPVSWYNLGLACEQSRDFPAALRALDQAIRSRPRHAPSYLHRGIVQGHLNQHDAELTDLTRALELDPTLTEAYRERARAHAKRNNPEAALRDVNRARQLGATFSEEFLDSLREQTGRSPE